MKKILVIGACGQIGSELIPKLCEKYSEDNVIAADYATKKNKSLHESVPFEFIDVTQKETIESVVKEYDIGTIYNLAALLSAIGEDNPRRCWEVNVNGLCNVLEIAREYKLFRVFHPSSIAVFGPKIPRDNTPQDISLCPNTMYGITKVAGELLCRYYFKRFGVDVRGVRYPGIVSSETLPGGGTTDYATAMFYEAISHKSYTCFLRAGTFLPMMYMPDCLRATMELMDADLPDSEYRAAYNLSAMSFCPEYLVAEIKKHLVEFTCDYAPDFRQNIADSWPKSIDDSYAREEWGWKPQYDLSMMVKDMLEKIRLKLDCATVIGQKK